MMKALAVFFAAMLILGCVGDSGEQSQNTTEQENPDDEFIKEYLAGQMKANNATKKTTTTTLGTTSTSSTSSTTTTIYDFNVTDDAIKAFRGDHKQPTTTTSSTTTSSTTTTTSPCLFHCSEIRYPSPQNCKTGCCYTTGEACEYSPGNLKSGGGPKCRCS